MQEEITPEQRGAREAPDPKPPGPGVDGRQKQFEALRRELVMDELLAVAVSPQDMPTRARAAERLGLDRLNGGFWQGFAPFGHQLRLGAEPITTTLPNTASFTVGVLPTVRN